MKRKRENEDDSMSGHPLYITKRRNISHLPIRSPPPSRPLISVTPAYGQYGTPPDTLTPDSIPEDEELQSNNLWPQHHHTADPPRNVYGSEKFSGSGSSNPGIVRTDATITDIEMEISSPRLPKHKTPIRLGRARSNDLMSPVHSPAQYQPTSVPLSPTHRGSLFAHQRVATPIASSFPTHSPFEASFATAATRQIRPHLHPTSLSPMVDAESWTPQMRGPPSPEPELEDATMVGMEDSHMMSSSFGALSVHSQDDADMPAFDSSPVRGRSSLTSNSSLTSISTYGLGLDGGGQLSERQHNTQMVNMINEQVAQHQHNRNVGNAGRTARLHMGYRTDCEKCVARVPGHYSHIIWS